MSRSQRSKVRGVHRSHVNGIRRYERIPFYQERLDARTDALREEIEARRSLLQEGALKGESHGIAIQRRAPSIPKGPGNQEATLPPQGSLPLRPPAPPI